MGLAPRSDAVAPARARLLVLGVATAAGAIAIAGCGGVGFTSGSADKTHGKTLFQQKCGSCHTLADAGTTGAIGPNLDDAFRQALKDGETESTIRQVVRGQIAYPITTTSTGAPGMPRRLVKGQDAADVAAYVASVAAKAPAGGTAAPPPAPATPPPTTPPTTAPSGGTPAGAATLAAGKKVFLSAGCVACHTLKDAGSSGTIGPKLDNLPADAKKAGKPLVAYVKTSIVDPNAYVVPGFSPGVMPPDFAKMLSPQQLADLVTYLSSVAGT